MTTYDDSFDDGWDDSPEDLWNDGYPDDDPEDDPEDDDDGGLFGSGPRPPAPGAMLGTDEAVHEHLLAVVGPERDGPRALWVVFLDHGDRVMPLAIPVGDLPTMVDRAMVANLAGVLRTMVTENVPGGCVAFALVRRSGGDRGTFEAGWSQALCEAMSVVDLRVRAIVAIGRDRSRVLPMNRVA